MNLQNLVIAAQATLLLCLPAFGQTLYRYVDGNGVVHYSDTPLLEATGRTIERISKGGTHLSDKPASTDKPSAVKSGDPPFPDAGRREQDAAARVEQRRNLALLATYNSLKEIDDARSFALRDARRELHDAQARMLESGRLREQLQTSLDAAVDREAIADLKQRLNNSTLEFKSLASLVEVKRRDLQSINERYDEDRRRYGLLQKGQTGADPIEPTAAARRN
jgi:hypothetical protein